MAIFGAPPTDLEATNAEVREFQKIRLIIARIGVVTGPLAITVIVASLFTHLTALIQGGLLLLAVTAFNNAVLVCFRTRVLFRIGKWTGMNGERIQRTDHPARFWVLIATNTVVLLGWAGAGAFLTWEAIFSPPRL